MIDQNQQSNPKRIPKRKKIGQAEGDTYEPEIRIQDMPSQGTCIRTPGWHSHRMHHLLSLLEHMFFLMLECKQYVIDIREQWALDQHLTVELAKNLGIRHPRIPYSSELSIMTTDFFVTLKKDNQLWYESYSVKPKGFLCNSRVMEKLRLEREYWTAQNIPWRLLTEVELDKTLVNNMKLIHNRRSAKRLGVDSKTLNGATALLTDRIREEHTHLREITNACDLQLGLPAGRSMKIVLHLIASGQWQIDLTKPISPFQPLNLIQK